MSSNESLEHILTEIEFTKLSHAQMIGMQKYIDCLYENSKALEYSIRMISFD